MKQGVGQGETVLFNITATAFWLLRSVLDAVNKTPVLCEVLYVLILQGHVKIASLSFVLQAAVCE